MASTASININVNSKSAQDNVDQLTGSINTAAGSAASLRLELRQTILELQQLEPGSARFQELSQRAGDLRDQIADTNAVVNQLAGNLSERLIRGITGVVQVGVAGFQAIAAGAALFGAESEDLEKTMVRLQALLNLSQALETFAGFDQKLVEIRASFQSLTVATNAQTVAQSAENVATETGVVATTALGTAMKALPIVAIVAALGTLVYGIYQYATASSEAEKNEKKRVETLKKQREEQEKARQSVAKESTEFVLLIGRLKETNANSEERAKLIKQINDNYGTTLKNLSDETKFQEQLNLEVANYIAYQKARYQLEKNAEVVQRNLAKQDELTQKLTKARKGLVAEEQKFRNLPPDALEAGTIQQNIRDYNTEVNKLEGELSRANKRLEGYYKVESDVNDIINEVTNGGKKYNDQIKDNTDKTKDATEANEKYANLLEKVKSEIDRQIRAEEELEEAQISRITNAQEREIKTLQQQFGQEREDLINGAIQREIEAFDEKFKKEGKSEEDYIKGVEEIRKRGADNLLEVEKKLLEEKQTFLDQDIQNINDKYKLESEIAQQAVTTIQNQTRLLELEFQKEQEIRAIENSVLTEEKKQEEILKIKQKYLDQEVELIKQQGQNQLDTLLLNKQKQLENEELTAEQRKVIEEQYNQDVLKINQDTQTQIQDAIDGTKQVQLSAVDELAKQIDKVSEYVGKISEVFSQFSDLISQRNQQNFESQSAQITALYEQEVQSLTDRFEQGILSREEFDNKIAQLDQQKAQEEKQLAMKKFQEQKKIQTTNAIIQGITATLAAYSSGAATPIIGVATGPIYAAIAAAFAAAQVAQIQNQTFTAAGGGIVPGLGSSIIDSVPSLLAPGETVINAESSAMFPNLLDSINQAGGGISLKPDLPATNKVDNNVRVFGDNKMDRPIRAYVVETDVTDTQRRVDRIKRSAEF